MCAELNIQCHNNESCEGGDDGGDDFVIFCDQYHSASMTMISSWLEPKPVKEAEEGSAGFNTE